MSKVRVNYKSDLPPVAVKFKINGSVVDVPDHDFIIRFFVDGAPGASFECIHKGDEYINCAKTAADTLTCYIDNHKFGCGRLCCEFIDLSANSRYSDKVLKTVTPSCLDVVLVEGAGDSGVEVLSIIFDYAINEIVSITAEESEEDGGTNVVTITETNGEEFSFGVKNGHTGNGIASIVTEESSISGAYNIVTITETNGEETVFRVKNGADGVVLEGDPVTYIADNLTTNDSEKILSARQGVEVKGLIGKVAIPRQTTVPADKYLNYSVGDTINLSSSIGWNGYYVFMGACAKGDLVKFGTMKGNNITPYYIVDEDLKVLSVGAKHNSSTPVSIPDLTVVDDDAAYIIINSRGETVNTVSGSGSLWKGIDDINVDLYRQEEVEVFPMIFHNCGFNSNGKFIYSGSNRGYVLNLAGLNAAQVKVPVGALCYMGFVMNDGTWQVAYDGSSGHKIITADVPTGAVRLKGAYNTTQEPPRFYLITDATLGKYRLKDERYIELKDNSNTLLSVVETSQTGRFAFQTVGVMDYLHAFDELSYSFPGFVKQTKVGDSQTPLASKEDQNTYPINHYTYTKPGVNPTKKFVLAGGLHGDSQGWTNTGGDSAQNIITIYYFLLDLFLHCNEDPFYKDLTDNYVIEVLPVMNPWGVQNHSRYNGRDVDLNRNFDCNWEGYASEHKGTAPFSEAESYAISTFINGLVNDGGFERYIEIHSRGEIILPGDNRWWGVCASTNAPFTKGAAEYVKKKYGGDGNFSVEELNYPGLWCWIQSELEIPACDVECAQSIGYDINTRNSKLVNFQMTEYVKWHVLMQLGVI